jgi:two-component system chemotaxis response regulator CheY
MAFPIASPGFLVYTHKDKSKEAVPKTEVLEQPQIFFKSRRFEKAPDIKFVEASMKLLIVDDSLLMRKAIERSLAGKNFTVVGSAADGEIGLRMFSESLPDLVTLDISMPKMDGLTCLEEMLKINPAAKILMISSQTDTVTASEVMQKGAAGILGKPFSSAQIQDKVDEILGA